MASPDPATRSRPHAPPSTPSDPALDVEFDREGLHALRSAVAAHADDRRVAPDQNERLLIIAGELAGNAVRHGGGARRLRLWVSDDQLRCQIDDQGAGLLDVGAGTIRPDPTAMGGRGLWMARHLSDEMVIDSGPHGTTVVAVIARTRDAERD